MSTPVREEESQCPVAKDQLPGSKQKSPDLYDSPIHIKRLLDVCCEDFTLVSDVLDTFCVQGRERLQSLESASKDLNLRQAIFDAMFLLGAAKNLGASQLVLSIEKLIEGLKSLTGASCLSDESCSLEIAAVKIARPSAIEKLVNAHHCVQEQFDHVEQCARNAIHEWHRDGKSKTPYLGHEPDLEMIFVQATLQSRSSADLRRRSMERNSQ